MILLQIAFWTRVLAASLAIGITASVMTMAGGWGPCGPSHLWQFAGLLTFAPCAAAAGVAIAMIALLGAGRTILGR